MEIVTSFVKLTTKVADSMVGIKLLTITVNKSKDFTPLQLKLILL